MQVIVNRSALVEVLNMASAVAASRTPRELLKCVRLTTVDGSLLVGATDLEVALRGEVRQVEVKAPGALLVPADKLMQIARESADETLTIESEDLACHVRGSDSHFEIYGHDPKEFPPVPDLEGDADVEVDASVLASLIERTLFAVAKENTRYAINGVLWETKAKRLSLVATDGRRLAAANGPVLRADGADQQMIVPAKTMQVLQRILPHAPEASPAGIRFSTNQVIIRAGLFVVSSPLVEGQFPNYEDVIPKDTDKKIALPTEEFHSAVRRAALLASDQSKGVRLAFDNGVLVLSSRTPEQGEATISMRVDYQSEALQIGFNPAFLADALRVVSGPTVVLELKEANRPGVLKAGSDFLYVIMPVSL
ncbi:MAG: DNA polymerase III subunit beta [Sedimentisphaerales bacterium]|nr:DNA polymerase III subunit beta [Sedimentisphaerales bacterium]